LRRPSRGTTIHAANDLAREGDERPANKRNSVTGSFSFDAINHESLTRANPPVDIHHRTPSAHLKRGPEPHATFVRFRRPRGRPSAP
jgi:hypothetical protein